MKTQDEALYTDTIHKFLTVYRYLRRHRHHQDVRARVAGEARGKELGGRKLSALRYLLQVGSVTMGQLGDYLYISDSSTSELIARLEQRGYVKRTRSLTDQRVVIVTLTLAGQDAAEQTPLSGFPLLREKLKSLDRGQLSVINQAMAEIADLLEIDNGH